MLNKIFILILGFVLIGMNAYSEETNNDVKDFVQMLGGDRAPSLDAFYYYCGEGNESELELEMVVCEKKGWTPAEGNPECLKYSQSRYANRLKTPSLYLEWLKTQVPSAPNLTIVKTDRIRGKNILEYDLVHAKLNDVAVDFFRTVGSENNIIQFGKLCLGTIGGTRVDKLLKEHLRKQNKVRRPNNTEDKKD
jgi:hypothetical protein